MKDARTLNEKIVGEKDNSQWALLYVHAAVRAWWLAEYSGCYAEGQEGTLKSSGSVLEAGQWR